MKNWLYYSAVITFSNKAVMLIFYIKSKRSKYLPTYLYYNVALPIVHISLYLLRRLLCTKS